MLKEITKKLRFLMIITLFATLLLGSVATNEVYAKPVKISPKSKVINVGKKFKIKIKNTNKKIKVSVSKKKIVKVKKTKKGVYTVTGKKAGKVNVIFKIGKKKYKCKVTVKKVTKKKDTPSSKPTNIQTSTQTTHIHKYVENERVEVACGQDGYVIYKCSCGNTKKDILYKIQEHVVSPWIIDINPTHLKPGKKHTECILCHRTIQEMEISKLPNFSLGNGGELTDDSDEVIDVEDSFKK